MVGSAALARSLLDSARSGGSSDRWRRGAPGRSRLRGGRRGGAPSASWEGWEGWADMSVVLAILYALLGLVLLLVLVPFRARASGSVQVGVPAGAARVDWGLWLLAVEVDSNRRLTLRLLELPVARFTLRAAREPGKERRPRKAKPERKGKAGAGGLQRLRAAVAEREPFQGMAARLARALHLRLRASGRVGIGDPADTAALWALLAALRALPFVELAIELEWVEEALELELELSARIWLAELLVVAALLLLARSNRRALRLAFGGGRT